MADRSTIAGIIGAGIGAATRMLAAGADVGTGTGAGADAAVVPRMLDAAAVVGTAVAFRLCGGTTAAHGMLWGRRSASGELPNSSLLRDPPAFLNPSWTRYHPSGAGARLGGARLGDS
jgi:hypothetical protein